jgi:hypothetical protein
MSDTAPGVTAEQIEAAAAAIGPYVRRLDSEPGARESVRRVYQLYYTAIERILGIPDDMVRPVDDKLFDLLFPGPDAPA